MKPYNLIIVLGSQPDTRTWKFPQQIYDCLDRSIELLNEGQAPLIAVSGKWTITFDHKGIQQPFRECDELANYLIARGIPDDKILREGDSEDTISNLYYLKKQILAPHDMKNLLFVVAEFRIPRLKFLCQRILGSEYSVSFEAIPCDPGPSYNEPKTFKRNRDFLEPMKDGDDSWLDDKFYTGWLFQPTTEQPR